MDSDNPLDPQKMNHVILHVGDGQYSYTAEYNFVNNRQI